VENNYAQWSDMVESGDHGDKINSASPPLYTNAGKTSRKNGAARPFQGWTAEGYHKFDILYNMVRVDCARETRTGFEDEWSRRIVAEENSRKRQTKQNEDDNGEEIQYLSHDFDDVMRGGIKSQSRILPDMQQPGDFDKDGSSNDEHDDEVVNNDKKEGDDEDQDDEEEEEEEESEEEDSD
jgi:hypothetical protein